MTGPMKDDFYLQSHVAIQGSKVVDLLFYPLANKYLGPRSAHYIVLHDDIFNGSMQK